MLTNTEIVDILRLKIPEPEEVEDGFLEIAGITHHENINSSIYAYFLNQKYPEISSVFMDALIGLIQEKIGDTKKDISMDFFDVQTEVPTHKQNRIDILIKDESNERAIIIENKIYHYLNNDLEDYFNFLDSMSDDNKIVVVLALEAFDFNSFKSGNNAYDKKLQDLHHNNHLVSITHKEWIDRIKDIKLPSNLPTKVYVYLNDFFNSIELLTKNTTMNESVKFYFENQTLVNKARDTYELALNYIQEEIKAAAIELNMQGKSINKSNPNAYIYENDTVYYTIITEKLFHGKNEIGIIIEFNGDFQAFDFKNKINKIIENYSHLKKGISTNRYAHLLHKTYPFDINKNEDLKSFIVQTILNEFTKPYQEILQLIESKVKHSNE